MSHQDNQNRKRVQFSIEDRARIMRLQEEIMGRIEEIARINVRTLEMTPRFPVKKFALSSSGGGTAAAPEIVAIDMTLTYDDGSQSCSSSSQGMSCSGPCPC